MLADEAPDNLFPVTIQLNRAFMLNEYVLRESELCVWSFCSGLCVWIHPDSWFSLNLVFSCCPALQCSSATTYSIANICLDFIFWILEQFLYVHANATWRAQRHVHIYIQRFQQMVFQMVAFKLTLTVYGNSIGFTIAK